MVGTPLTVEALYKEPRFRLVGPVDGKPVVFDDATYFVSFELLEDAVIVQSVLEWSGAGDLLSSLIFTDSKRPITKRVLQQVDIGALLDACPKESVQGRAKELARNMGSEAAGLDDAWEQLRSCWREAAGDGSP